MIYLDNGATTRPLYEWSKNPFHNPYNEWLNSHTPYSNGDNLLWECREKIAKCIGAKPNEIFFTSGGCEGNTWCINILYNMLERPVLVSPNEHKSIINNPRIVMGDGKRVDKNTYDYDSCMLVNNETGVMYKCDSIHKDMVQALGKVKINVRDNKCRMATFSGHKIHGDKGVGFVWIDEKVHKYIEPLIYGGAQEFGLRGGTSNVNGVLHMTDCVEMVTSKEHLDKNKVLYDYFMENIIDGLVLNAIPCIPTFSLRNNKYNGEYLVNRLMEKGVFVSTGSGCSTGEGSYVLKNLGLTDDEASATIRVSLDGEENSKEDIDTFFREVGEILNE